MRSKQIPLLILVAASLIWLAQNKAHAQDKPIDLSSTTISMRVNGRDCGVIRTAEVGGCPSYNITIAGGGTVTYEGIDSVRVKGKRTHHISANSVRELVEEFYRADFFSLAGRYEVEAVDHSIGVEVTMTEGVRTKSVYSWTGEPKKLTELEHKIFLISQVARYVGRTEQQVQANRY